MAPFGVIVCSKCSRAYVIDLSRKSGTCTTCGRREQLGKHYIYFRSDSREEAVSARSMYDAQLRGEETEFRSAMEEVGAEMELRDDEANARSMKDKRKAERKKATMISQRLTGSRKVDAAIAEYAETHQGFTAEALLEFIQTRAIDMDMERLGTIIDALTSQGRWFFSTKDGQRLFTAV